MTKDSFSQVVLLESLQMNTDSVGLGFSITGGTLFGSGIADAFNAGSLFKKENLPSNIAMPYVYKGNSFHLKMPEVSIGGIFYPVKVARIFKNGKWNTLTADINIKHESVIQGILINSISDKTDSVSQIITMGV